MNVINWALAHPLDASAIMVVLFPLLGFLILTFGRGRLTDQAAKWVGVVAVGLAFASALNVALVYTTARSAEPTESPTDVEATRPVEVGEGSAAEEAAHGGAHRVQLWNWMDLGGEVLITVAAEELEDLVQIERDQVMQVWWPIANLERQIGPTGEPLGTEGVQALLSEMWPPDAVTGVRPIQAPVAQGDVLTIRNVPPQGAPPAPEIVTRGGMNVDIAFQVDQLSLLMILVVTGVGFLIHLYSAGYMAHDADVRRYFAYLNLFVLSMLILVLAADFLVLFVGWELVGLCSYLLIGFWYRDSANASAGRKAFIVNRVGDFGFLIGLMLIWSTFGSLAFENVFPNADAVLEPGGLVAVLIAGALLVGATGKSAQIPLYVWLPDAMAGPTPVSALIHAATMVTAGVYMIVRAHALFELAPSIMALVAAIGAATALLAALIAVVQVDIKRVLAYSTISQLGYMMMAVGAAAYVAGVFHLMTHAFFKALLFLGAGSVMHAMEHGFGGGHGDGAPAAPVVNAEAGTAGPSAGISGASISGASTPGASTPSAADDALAGSDWRNRRTVADIEDAAYGSTPPEQDMRQMGGLWSKLRWTAPTFAAGSLALAGLFPFAGFWSKDEILFEVFAHGGAFWSTLYLIGLVTAFLTAFYTGRALFMVFAGGPRSDGARHALESPAVMTVPLVILGILSVVGGLPGIPVGETTWMTGWLEPVVGHAEHPAGPKLLLALVASVMAVGGLGLAWTMYVRGAPSPGRLAASAPWAYRLAAGKFYVDELYTVVFVRPFKRLADFLWRVVDDGLIDGAVNAVARAASGMAGRTRSYQTGYVRSYALSMLVGAVAIALYVWWWVAP